MITCSRVIPDGIVIKSSPYLFTNLTLKISIIIIYVITLLITHEGYTQRRFLYVFSSDTHVIENQQNKNI